MRERLKHHVRLRRLLHVGRGVYAAVPYGISSEAFQPDPFLVAAALRSDAVFAYYSAFTLLGTARVEWKVVTILTSRRRRPLNVGGTRLEFASQPPKLIRRKQGALGLRTVDRLGRVLRVTGPERTLVDGMRQPDRTGGLAEVISAAAGFAVLDLDLVRRLLEAYNEKNLWAAVGWFLERHRDHFSVPDDFLRRLERHRPKSRVYLRRGERGRLASRWNLMLPESVLGQQEPG
jgi:predicted transcriptional regulator of viral defense system